MNRQRTVGWLAATTALLLFLWVDQAAAQSALTEAHERGQKALQEARYGDAARAFEEALSMAPPDKPAILAGLSYYRGAALGMNGDLLPAIASVRQALHYAPHEAAYQKLLAELERRASQEVIPASQISRALKTSRSFAAEGGEPAGVDLWVNFDFDKDTLSARGRQQTEQLAQALQSAEFASLRFRLIGHTDSQGSEDYNQRLSERRARRMVQSLSSDYGIDPSRLLAVGHGEREPKQPGSTEEAYAVNRRVEVQVMR